MPTYNPSGQINLTVVGGTVPVGHYAADGSWNIVVNAGTGGPIGLYHPSGAYNAVVVTDPGSPYYSANGSMNVIANAASPSGFSPVQPRGFSSGGTAPTITGFNNFTGSNLPNWNIAKSAVSGSTRNGRVIAYGDSTTAGFGGAGGTGSNGNAIAFSYPTQLAALLSSGRASSMIGTHNTTDPAFDTRIAAGVWVSDNNSTMGGFAYRAGTPGPLTFTPANQIDTIEQWTFQNPGLGTFTINVDGGSTLATVVENGASSMLKTVVSTTLGNHAINLAWSSGVSYNQGIIAYNSAVKEMSVVNAGYISATSTVLADAGSFLSPLAVLPFYTPDLTIIEGGIINDWRGGSPAVPLATSQTNLQAIITAAKRSGSGDVILISPVPSNPGQAGLAPSYVVQQTYVDMMKALAITNGIPFIDAWRLFSGTWQASWMFDDLHPNVTGYGLVAGYCNTALANGFVAA